MKNKKNKNVSDRLQEENKKMEWELQKLRNTIERERARNGKLLASFPIKKCFIIYPK